MEGPDAWKIWFGKLEQTQQQMRNHWLNSGGRIVEYHFAEQSVADYFRADAIQRGYFNIIVFYTPSRYR